MVFARLLRNLVRDPTVGSLVAPIVSDEARTFGLEPLIAEAKIYAPEGQHYIPVDADLPLNYAESASGQLLQEGISEAGALSTFIALSTAYATWGQPMVPVFLFYSMFGFQRVGDLAWALGDMRGRGILAGCTAGRTTLMGEGLQHDDGQSPLLASTNPAALVYDASFAYEVAVIMEAAVTDMLGAAPQDRFWYLTLYNETYPMPALPKGADGEAVRKGIIDGIYRFAAAPEVAGNLRTSLCFSGPMWTVAVDAQRILAERYGVAADTWAVTSWTNLRTDALEVERWNRLHPEAEPRTAVITDGTRRRARSRRRHHRLHARRARPGGAVRAPPLHVARDRRLRALRRPGRPAVVLRGRHGQPGGRRVAAARPGRTDRPLGGRRGHRRLGHRRRRRRLPSSSDPIRVEQGTNAASTSWAPSGTARISVRRSACSATETSKNGQQCFSRWARSTAVVRAASESPSTRRTAVSPASTDVTEVERTRARHSSARSRNDAASRLQAIGTSTFRRHRRRLTTSASRVSSICPRCWNSSSRTCTSTAPLVSL